MVESAYINVNDEFCKRVLRIKPVMAYMLKECVEEFFHLSRQEIIEILSHENKSQIITELNTEDIEITGAKIIYDIKTKVSNGKEDFLIDLEPQGLIKKDYPLLKRSNYSSARLMSGQKNKPYGFQKSDFSNVLKCCSFWIVIHPPRHMKGIHNTYRMCEFQERGHYHEQEDNYNLQRIFLLCLTDKIDATDKSVVMMLSVLLNGKMSIKDRVFLLKEEYGIILTEEEEREVADMSAVWEGYYEYGVEEGLQLGIELGIEKGIEQGIEQGIAQGNEQGKNQMAINNVIHLMKNLSIDAETAMNLLNIPDYLKVVVIKSINT